MLFDYIFECKISLLVNCDVYNNTDIVTCIITQTQIICQAKNTKLYIILYFIVKSLRTAGHEFSESRISRKGVLAWCLSEPGFSG